MKRYCGTWVANDGRENGKRFGININNYWRTLTVLDTGDWVRFRSVDFGSGMNQFSVTAATPLSGAAVQIRIGSPTGSLAGTLNFEPTSDWGVSATRTTTLNMYFRGRLNVYFVFVGAMNIDSFRFSNAAASTSNFATKQVANTASSPSKDLWREQHRY